MHTLHTVEEQISFVTVTVTQLHVELIPTICAKNCKNVGQAIVRQTWRPAVAFEKHKTGVLGTVR